MGFNTVLFVLNDRLDEIEKDTEFGKKVAAAIREHRVYGESKPSVMAERLQILSYGLTIAAIFALSCIAVAYAGG